VKRIRLRSGLATLALLIAAGVGWFYFAPIKIGGQSRYVVTSGISMEPHFHTGGLAIVRPVSNYRVGEIVAYWSTLLHTVVLHRIIARDGNTYVFKGDNNHFIDPVRPTRSELLGKLWLHVPHFGRVLEMLHTPVAAALLCAVVGLLALFGVTEGRRRHRRRRKGETGSGRLGIPIVNIFRDHRRINFGALLTASALAAAAFVVLGMIAFTRSASRAVPSSAAYTQQVQFGYGAHVRSGLIYPTGTVTTGDPIFLTLVRRVGVSVDYRLNASAPSKVTGTEEVLLQINGPSGWTRNLVVTPPTPFSTDRTTTEVTLTIPALQSLLARVAALTGGAGVADDTVSVVAQISLKGTVAGHPINSSFAPALSFGLTPTQLVPDGVTSSAAAGPTTTAGPPKTTYSQSKTGTVMTAPGSAPTTLTVFGVSPTISLLRWIAAIGLLLSIPLTLYAFLAKRSEPFDESVQIQSQFGHMIVPIVAGEDLGWPAVDVPTIKGLAKLAESGQRLILHSRSNGIDTYMVNDEGTVYRYQVRPSKVVWGEWSETATPVKVAA
jgi:signal peptidase I